MKFRVNVRKPSVWIAILSMIGVCGFVVTDLGRRPSPGPLAEVHGREEDLNGSRDCSECHGGWGETMNDACLECHKDIGEQVTAQLGLHGKLIDRETMQCGSCHADHHGADFPIVNEQSFTAAGIEDPLRFDHRLVDFAMDGKHLELECVECHKHSSEPVLAKGDRRFVGLQQSCTPCHDDPHKGRMAQSCVQCHDQTAWKNLFFLEHDRHLQLVGGHASISCRDCHAKSDQHALEAIGREPGPAPRACVDCHPSPHMPKFVNLAAKRAGLTPANGCIDCHLAEHTGFLHAVTTTSNEQHAFSGFKLVVPHDVVHCDECHAPELDSFKRRYPGRGPNDCASCHEDSHGGQFNTRGMALRSCVHCHARERFEPHAFTVEKHKQTRFPLTGSHVKTKCNECHEGVQDMPRVFKGTAATCDRCHQDAHAGFFDARLAQVAPHKDGQCALCHLTSAFKALPKNGFDHAKWTGFAIVGAHKQEECESCHPLARKPDEFGRTFGRVVERFGPYRGCVSCHKDPHEGAFDVPERPKVLRGRNGCARCHDETSFRSISEEWEHGEWTGYELDGAHADLDCTACHPLLKAKDARGRTTSRAKGKDCAACHEDPHAGQFVRGGKVDCQRCHRSLTSFSDVFFNHQLQSRFRLDDTHVQVECAGCHLPDPKGNQPFIRYRPLGMECSDCHGAPKDPLNRRKGKHK